MYVYSIKDKWGTPNSEKSTETDIVQALYDTIILYAFDHDPAAEFNARLCVPAGIAAYNMSYVATK